MADILIRGVEMPKGDLEYVSLWVYGDGRVYVRNKESAASSQRLQDLAVPLPDGHGKLGDLDALEAKFREEALEHTCIGNLNRMTLGVGEVIDRIRMADTTVPSEGGGDT